MRAPGALVADFMGAGAEALIVQYRLLALLDGLAALRLAVDQGRLGMDENDGDVEAEQAAHDDLHDPEPGALRPIGLIDAEWPGQQRAACHDEQAADPGNFSRQHASPSSVPRGSAAIGSWYRRAGRASPGSQLRCIVNISLA